MRAASPFTWAAGRWRWRRAATFAGGDHQRIVDGIVAAIEPTIAVTTEVVARATRR